MTGHLSISNCVTGGGVAELRTDVVKRVRIARCEMNTNASYVNDYTERRVISRRTAIGDIAFLGFVNIKIE